MMRDHLAVLGAVIREYLENQLPQLGEGWWQTGVVSALSFQQRQIVTERGWTSLGDLDLAALLRVVDGNWDFLKTRSNLSYESRNWLKEALSIRNRHAHESLESVRDPKREYRDVDTLARLAEALNPGAAGTAHLARHRDETLAVLAPPVATVATPDPPGGLAAGAVVRLVARPTVIGVVTAVAEGSKERTFTVFHDGAAKNYFASQIELVGPTPAGELDPQRMRAGITATQLLHPAANHLYSFNSGRIEYEPYQFRPVMKLISADRPRLLIADDVGVGKTIEAALIIKELQARQPLDSVLVICPKQLVVEHKWRSELRRFDEDFVELDSATLRYCIDETRLEGQWPSRYRKAILPYSLLDERLLLGSGDGRQKRHGLASLVPPAKFDLVLVDEAHHIRNTDTWRHRVVKHLLDAAEAAVLISATPIQTGSDDLFNLLQLLRPDILIGASDFERMRAPNAHIARAEELARAGERGWRAEAIEELEQALATQWGAAVMLSDPRCQETRDLLATAQLTDADRVRAVRSLQRLNTFSGLINRTRRRDIGAFTTRKPETVEVDFTPEQRAVHDELLIICARIVGARQPSMSIEFLLSTLKRQASSCINGLAPFITDLLEGRLSDEELSEADVEGSAIQSDDLTTYRDEIRALAIRASDLADDPKLDALLSIIREKQSLHNNKLLVFSTFRHTLRYLLPRLSAAGVRVGLVHGDVPDHQRREFRARFALDRTDPDAFDVLLSSEVGTEGLDNQFCDALVNYDIPWNPMRIEQRIGRIDRRGQRSEAVSIKNMVVRNTVDAKIFHRCLERIGVFRQSLGGSEEILGELTREMRAIAEDLALTEEQRDEKLHQLADNKLARIQEQAELEDRQASLFGLAVQKLDEEGVERAASPWLSAERLACLVETYLSNVGHARSTEMFQRPVAVLRPDKEVRARLLEDLRSLDVSSAVATRWGRWLEGSSDASRRLTFEPESAVSDDIELLSATHPLVRAAAKSVEPPTAGSVVALVTRSSAALRPGRYPFAVFSWTTLGLRDSHDIRVVTSVPEQDEEVERLLLTAEQGGARITDDESDALAARHYDAWVDARTEHVERARVHVAARLASLELSHRARIAQLEDQLASAAHENIRRMRESELRSAEDDFARRATELANAASRCDITTTELCRGILEVS
jgi:ATP-dependent helicase HepA